MELKRLKTFNNSSEEFMSKIRYAFVYNSSISFRNEGIVVNDEDDTFIIKNGNSEKIPFLCKKEIYDFSYGYGFDYFHYSAYGDHLIALSRNGEIFGYGNNKFKQIMDSDEKYIKNPTKIGLQFQGVVKQIACGKFHTMVLTDNNCILIWGSNEYGQCGKVTDIKIVESPFKVKIDEDEIIKSIVCGEKHSLVLYDNGTVYGWGSNEYGQLGLGKIKVQFKPIKMTIGYDNIKQIVCGSNYTLALTNDGIVYAMGSNKYGQLMNGNHFFIRAIDVTSVLIPLFPLLFPQSYPLSFSLLVVPYFPYTFQFIQSLKNYLNVYKPITIKMKFKEIAAHGGTSMGIDMNGECFIWGNIKRFWGEIFIPKKVENCRSLNGISALFLGITNKTIQVDEN